MSSEKSLTFPIKLIAGEESRDTITLTLKLKNLNNYVIQRAYLAQRFNERQGTANTLTRAEVRGGGRKPWRQKGTGKARAGSNTSPLWRGGGVSFGPKPKLYSNKVNRKEWQLSLRSLLFAKQKDIIVIDDITITEYKTQTIVNILKRLNISQNESTLLIIPKIEAKLRKSTNNLNYLKLVIASNLNLKQILLAKNLVITKDSLKIIEGIYNG